MNINWKRLTDYFSPEDIEWKPGAITRDKSRGLAMGYITARAVQDRLDEVFGPGGWKNEFRSGPEGGVICRIYFRNDDGDWVWREDGADNTDIEAVKGGLSNALKRAGSALGIGRYLYDLPSQWVPLNEKGRFAEVPRIPGKFLPRHANRDTPEHETTAQAAAYDRAAPNKSPRTSAKKPSATEPMVKSEAVALIAHGMDIGLDEEAARLVLEEHRNKEGHIPANAESAIRDAMNKLALVKPPA